MRLLRFHVVPLQELAVVDMEVFDSRDGDKEIGTDIANFALYVALLVTRIWIAELHAAPIMRAEVPEQLRLMHVATGPLANLSKIRSGGTPPMYSKMFRRSWQTHPAVSPPNACVKPSLLYGNETVRYFMRRQSPFTWKSASPKST